MKKLLFLAFAFSFVLANAQVSKQTPQFDEEKVRKAAIKKGVPANALDEFVNGQRVRFMQHYHPEQSVRTEKVTVVDINTNKVIGNNIISTSSCQNSDLSMNNYSNWTGDVASSCNTGSQYPVASWLGTGINGTNGSPVISNTSPCSANNSNEWHVIHNQPILALSTNAATALANGYDDNCKNPSTGFYDLSCTPANGTNSIRLGSGYANYTCQKLVYPLFVTSANAQFTYQFAVVIDDGGHTVGEQPAFLFGVKDVNGNLISGVNQNCVQYNIDATAASTDTSYIKSSTPCSGINVYYRKWRTVTIDLTSQINNWVYAEFQTLDCVFSGHYAYAYISATCGNLTANVSGFCGGAGTVVMTAPPGFANYQWYGPNNTTPISGATASSYTASGAVNGDVFTVDCITLQGCTTKLNVTVAASNIVATGVGTPSCRGGSNGSASVSVLGGTQYTYTWTPTGLNTSSISNQPAGTYSVLVHDVSSAQCPDTTVVVTIGQINPNLQNVTDTLCGTQVVLNGPTPGSNYTWYDNNNANTGVTTANYTVTNGAGGQYYTVTYINPSTGCLDSIRTTLNQINIQFNPVSSPPCNGGNNGSITVSPVGVQSFPTYDWTMSGAQTGGGTNVPIPPSLQITGLPGGSYTVAINPSGNPTCTYVMTVTLTPGLIPAPVLDTLKGCALDNLSIPTNTVSGNTHNWYQGSTSLGSSYPYVTTGVVQGAVYTDTIRNSFGCISVYKAYLKVKSFKVTVTSPAKIECHDDSSGKIKVTANQEINGPLGTPYVFTWNFPSPYPDPAPITTGVGVPQSNQQNNLHAGTYTITVTSGNCVTTATYNLTNPPLLTHDSLLAYFCPKDSLTWLFAEPGHPKYNWYHNGVAIPNYNNDSILVTPSTVGEYYVWYLQGGCRDTADMLFTFPSIHALRPDKLVNIFTPNGDNRNDRFYPFYDENISYWQIDKQMEEYNIVIYNRWGKKVYESNSYINPWDGKVSGEDQSDGTYYFILTYKSNCSTKADLVEKHGFVQLLR